MTFAYDAGVLIAADRDDRRTWIEHQVRLSLGIIPITTAPVVARASRSDRQPSRSDRQRSLGRFLKSCEVVPFATTEAHAVGALLESSDTADVVDAHLVLIAASAGATLITTDVRDLELLSSHLPAPVPIVRL